ncbi:Pestheic acid cluster transcriptional regulator [Lachnellula occidentalis]|uniref:Pestheic acid cluster transcriptional regulator n=1 Tax=Lachnellula occidentalis TaxID=215460 RepID=A0A8H8UI08_9HELO|nr:Pestheic acid cluster transcriptional regulator [Lachnellula occidentalis]
MSGPLRSKAGCWTCRLRKKKCDEKHPFCSTCEALTITCYGYGSKPDWMDNGEKEKAMAHSIKQVVKHTSRRKGRLGTSISQLQNRYSKKSGSQVVNIAPKSLDGSSSSSPDSNLESDHPTAHSNSPANPGPADTSMSPSVDTLSEAQSTPHQPSSILAVSSNESILLMHFLDNVFCLQYPFYKPGVHEGGRGWLLSLLMKTKPLYHASLALSAYHRSAIFLAENRCQYGVSEQQEHLAICLKELQLAMKNIGKLITDITLCPRNGLGTMASSVQLIFFELFAGHGDAWRFHLRAATTLFSGPYKAQMAMLGLEALHSPSDLGKDGHEKPKSEDVVIFRFLSAVLAWLDIVSTITTGKLPHVIHSMPEEISSSSGIRLENVMGCKNWVMLQIGRISGLYEYKTEAIRQGQFVCAEFGGKSEEIRRELQIGLASSSLSFLSLSDPEFASACNAFITPHQFTTHLFALSATIYLHLVVFGYQSDSETLKPMVAEAITVIRRHIPADLTHALVCPLYIIGSAARSEDEALFRHIFSSPPLLDPSLEHRAKFLPLLEEIWRMRETGWEWETNIQLSGSSLLLI